MFVHVYMHLCVSCSVFGVDPCVGHLPPLCIHLWGVAASARVAEKCMQNNNYGHMVMSIVIMATIAFSTESCPYAPLFCMLSVARLSDPKIHIRWVGIRLCHDVTAQLLPIVVYVHLLGTLVTTP